MVPLQSPDPNLGNNNQERCFPHDDSPPVSGATWCLQVFQHVGPRPSLDPSQCRHYQLPRMRRELSQRAYFETYHLPCDVEANLKSLWFYNAAPAVPAFRSISDLSRLCCLMADGASRIGEAVPFGRRARDERRYLQSETSISGYTHPP